MNDVLKHPELPWDWAVLSMKKDITMTHVMNNGDIPWSWVDLSCNPYLVITMADVLNNPEKPWDWKYMSAGLCEVRDIEQGCRRWFMTKKIQRQFRTSLSDPSYKMCRERLLREWKECLDQT